MVLNKRNPRAWLSVLLVIVLAGCLAADPPTPQNGTQETDSEDPTDGENEFPEELGESDIAAALNATEDPEMAGDWFLMPAAAGEDRPLAAFNWTVPEGALQPSYWNDDLEVIPLEAMAFVTQGNEEAIDELILLAFVIRDGEADHLVTHASGVWHSRETRLTQNVAWDETTASLLPWWLKISDQDVAAGDEMFFVVAAQSNEPVELAVGFRVMDHDPDPFEEEPTPDPESFLALVDGTPLALERAGTATGYRYALYMDIGGLFYDPVTEVDFLAAIDMWTDDAQWTETMTEPLGVTRPLASARELTISFGHDVPKGWGFGWGFAMVTGGTGTWEADVDVHGQRAQSTGVLGPWATAFSAPYEEVGVMAYYLAEGEGEGGASALFHVTYADVIPFVYLVMSEHLDLAVTLEELTGTPGLSEVYTSGMEGEGEISGRSLDHLPAPVREQLALTIGSVAFGQPLQEVG